MRRPEGMSPFFNGKDKQIVSKKKSAENRSLRDFRNIPVEEVLGGDEEEGEEVIDSDLLLSDVTPGQRIMKQRHALGWTKIGKMGILKKNRKK